MADEEILCERRGAAGLITLNRPQALNALTPGMLSRFQETLRHWAEDDTVACVVVMGAGDRAFCAGGDIRLLYDLGRAGRFDEAVSFFREEYLLNAAVKRFPKAYVSLIDGVWMGGGLGVSVHGSHRVAGERLLMAMPEVGIGLFPDVGATYVLPRLPGATGTYLALTGRRIRTGDALALGLATHASAAADFIPIVEELAAGEPANQVLDRYRQHPGEASVTKERSLIDACFGAATVEAILDRLDEAAGQSPFAASAAAAIRTGSPTSLKIAHEQMRRGAGLSFPEAMRTEYRIVNRVLRGHDFYEGVRAAIIDKDGAARWRPASLAEIGGDAVREYFAELGPDELQVN